MRSESFDLHFVLVCWAQRLSGGSDGLWVNPTSVRISPCVPGIYFVGRELRLLPLDTGKGS